MHFVRKFCPNCQAVATPSTQAKGGCLFSVFLWGASGLLLVVSVGLLWPVLLIPLGYTLWRMGKPGVAVCPRCRAPNMVSLDSPVARKALGA